MSGKNLDTIDADKHWSIINSRANTGPYSYSNKENFGFGLNFNLLLRENPGSVLDLASSGAFIRSLCWRNPNLAEFTHCSVDFTDKRKSKDIEIDRYYGLRVLADNSTTSRIGDLHDAITWIELRQISESFRYVVMRAGGAGLFDTKPLQLLQNILTVTEGIFMFHDFWGTLGIKLPDVEDIFDQIEVRLRDQFVVNTIDESRIFFVNKKETVDWRKYLK